MYPDERSLVAELQDKPFALIGVNSDPDKDKLRPRLIEERIAWRSFWNGPQGTQGPISKAWHVTGWPTLYVIDHEGIIRWKGHGGPQLEPEVRAWVERAERARADKARDQEPGRDR